MVSSALYYDIKETLPLLPPSTSLVHGCASYISVLLPWQWTETLKTYTI